MATFNGTTGNDTLRGTAGADTINGRAGNDTLDGRAGNDTLNGGAGIDSITGGDGNDTLIGGLGADSLTGGRGADIFKYSAFNESNAASGIDTIRDFVPSVDTIDLSVFGGATLVSAYHAEYSSVLQATLVYSGGKTTLSIYNGSSTPVFQLYISGNATSLAGIIGINRPPAPAVTIDDVTKDEAAGTMTFTVTRSGIGVIETASSVNFATSDDTATAGSDYTALNGTLNFAVGETTKTITVSIGDDSDSETVETLKVTLSGGTNVNITDALGVGTITDNDMAPVAVIEGTDGNDSLYSYDYTSQYDRNEIIRGLAGDDLLYGAGGDDTLEGGSGVDGTYLNFSSQTNGVTYALGDGSVTTSEGVKTLSSIEWAYFTGTAYDDNLTGGIGNDSIHGQSGSDILNGGDGNDYVTGGNGEDILSGGAGDDSLDSGSGDDTIDGGDGTDAVYLSFAGESQGVTYTLENGTVSPALDGTKTLSNIEAGMITGSQYADSLTGGAYNDSLDAQGGNDTLNGLAGDDTLYGSNGDDTLNGGDGNDTLGGNEDNDTLNGGDGNDTLSEYSGSNTLNGGNGDDSLEARTSGTNLFIGGNGADTLYLYSNNEREYYQPGQEPEPFGFDTAAYTALSEGGDTIVGFGGSQDKIDLSAVDDPRTEGDDVWAFAGSSYDSNIAGPQATISMSGSDSVLSLYMADGNDEADFTIILLNATVTQTDVIW
jgi:Ca2+-binding RTX toxin-like protein